MLGRPIDVIIGVDMHKHTHTTASLSATGAVPEHPRVTATARWAAIEAISRNHGGDKIKADYRRIAERGVSTSAASPRPARCSAPSPCGLRDGEIRCLAPVEGD